MSRTRRVAAISTVLATVIGLAGLTPALAAGSAVPANRGWGTSARPAAAPGAAAPAPAGTPG